MQRNRMTAAERREQVLAAAVTAFGDGGYAGTSTHHVARLAGVSQPYVVRLFTTKRELFCAALQRASDRAEAALRRAAEGEPTAAGLEKGFRSLLADRATITVLLQGFAAGSDPVIGTRVRDCFGRLCAVAGELTGAGPHQVGALLGSSILSAGLLAAHTDGDAPRTTVPPARDRHGALPERQ